MNFGEATERALSGNKIVRSGWNGKSMFLFMVEGGCWSFDTDIQGVDDLHTLPFLCMKTADGKLVPWLASQTDVLSNDWEVLNEVPQE